MNIAVVEDKKEYADEIVKMIERYSSERSIVVNAEVFGDGLEFLNSYRGGYALVLMDVEMPVMDGLKTAEKLREVDKDVPLVFVTHMMQYAINGYAVEAMDYIVKPINYSRLASIIDKAEGKLKRRNAESTIVVHTAFKDRFVDCHKIRYIEISGHKIIVYADVVVETWGSLNKFMELLPEELFVRVNKYTIANVEYVTEIGQKTCRVGNKDIAIGKNCRDCLSEKLGRYLGSL